MLIRYGQVDDGVYGTFSDRVDGTTHSFANLLYCSLIVLQSSTIRDGHPPCEAQVDGYLPHHTVEDISSCHNERIPIMCKGGSMKPANSEIEGWVESIHSMMEKLRVTSTNRWS